MTDLLNQELRKRAPGLRRHQTRGHARAGSRRRFADSAGPDENARWNSVWSFGPEYPSPAGTDHSPLPVDPARSRCSLSRPAAVSSCPGADSLGKAFSQLRPAYLFFHYGIISAAFPCRQCACATFARFAVRLLPVAHQFHVVKLKRPTW